MLAHWDRIPDFKDLEKPAIIQLIFLSMKGIKKRLKQ